MVVLTTKMEAIVKANNINTNFTNEQLSNVSFKQKWTSYLLSIMFNVTIAELVEEDIKEYTELIFG